MQWYKDPSMHYTDLCKYIDEHIPDMAKPGVNPDVENKVYNYLWLLVKALAIKKRMFQSFQDYDGYAFYSASRLFNALRNNYNNQGKIIKGKQIVPIKSSLNYTKRLLYPMKLEFQKESFNVIISEEFTSKQFNAMLYSEKLKSNAQASQDNRNIEYVEELLNSSASIIDTVLAKSPFKKDSPEYKKLRMSILLNACHDLSNKHKFDLEPTTIILWKLPKSMGGYVKVLLKEFYTSIKSEIIECMNYGKLDDDLLNKLLAGEDTTRYEDYD